MNDVMPVSPTALEYTAILDTYTLIKGVPALNPHKRRNKKKSPEKSSQTIEIGKIRYNPESSMKEQHQYDLQYKSYFGDESLELHEDSQEALLSELNEEPSPKVPLRHSLSQNIARSPARSRNNNSNNGGRSGGYKTNDAISAEWRQRIDEQAEISRVHNWRNITGGEFSVKNTAKKNMQAINFILFSSKRGDRE